MCKGLLLHEVERSHCATVQFVCLQADLVLNAVDTKQHLKPKTLNYGGHPKSSMKSSTVYIGNHGIMIYEGHAGLLVSAVWGILTALDPEPRSLRGAKSRRFSSIVAIKRKKGFAFRI